MSNLILAFLRSCFSSVWSRKWLIVVLNWLFFGLIVIGSFLAQAGFVGVYSWPFEDMSSFGGNNPFLLFGFIFVSNLVLSSLVLVTLTGVVFFGLSLFFLSLRALLWGILLSGLSTPMFLVALPTLVLEGEGYVLAALTGVNLGMSWIRPRWTYGQGKDLSRLESLKRALKDGARVYVLVTLFLLAAAILETVTLISVSP